MWIEEFQCKNVVKQHSGPEKHSRLQAENCSRALTSDDSSCQMWFFFFFFFFFFVHVVGGAMSRRPLLKPDNDPWKGVSQQRTAFEDEQRNFPFIHFLQVAREHCYLQITCLCEYRRCRGNVSVRACMRVCDRERERERKERERERERERETERKTQRDRDLAKRLGGVRARKGGRGGGGRGGSGEN